MNKKNLKKNSEIAKKKKSTEKERADDFGC